MEEAAVQVKDSMSVVSDVEGQLQREVVATELQPNDGVEEEAEAPKVNGKGSIKDDCAVEELKAQVQDLQRHIISLQASQQEQAQRQFQELKDLLLNRIGS